MRNEDPIKAKKKAQQQEILKRQQRQQILQMADDFTAEEDNRSIKHRNNILQSWLDFKEKEYDKLIREPVKNILEKGESRYLLKRTALETEIATVKNVLGISDKYIKEAERIRKQSSSERQDAKK